MIFTELLQPKSLELVNAVKAAWMPLNQAFYEGDHLQKGAGWIGPGPLPTASDYGTFVETLSPAFISQNVVATVTDNKVNAYCNDDIKWGTVLRRALKEGEEETKEESDLKAEADAALMEWWNCRDILGTLTVFSENWELYARAGLRRFIPPGKLDDNGMVPTVGELAQALDFIYVESPSYANFHLYRDSETMEEVGIYLYTKTETVDGKETDVAAAELSFLEIETVNGAMRPLKVPAGEKRKTTLRIVTEKEVVETNPLQLGGYLWHFEAVGKKPLITEQVRSQQRYLNLAKTVGRKNLADNGWLEEFLLGAQLPGKYEGEGDEKKFVPEPQRRGPGIIRDIKGQTVENDSGTSIISPSVTWRPIVDPSGSITTAEDAERSIHKETAQLHTLDEGGGNVSGETLKQRRATFKVSLEKSASTLAEATRWLLESALAQAALYMGKPGRYDALRVEVTPRMNTGPLTSEELNEITSRMKDGYLSEETGLAEQGIRDVDAERGRIEKETEQRKFGESFHPAMDGSSDGLPDVTGGDPAAVDENGNPVAAGVATSQALNGAQYDGLLKTLGLFSAKILAEGTALQGLVALGISEETAKSMLESQKSIALTPEQLAAAGV